MYKNFGLTEEEKKEILNRHEENGYKKGPEPKQSLDEQVGALKDVLRAAAVASQGARNLPTSGATPSQIGPKTIEWMKTNRVYQGQYVANPSSKTITLFYLPSSSGGFKSVNIKPIVTIATPADARGNGGDWSFNPQTNKITYVSR